MNAKPPIPAGSRTETADYIADLSGHLAAMARGQGLNLLGYLLDMARMEAEQAAKGERSRAR